MPALVQDNIVPPDLQRASSPSQGMKITLKERRIKASTRRELVTVTVTAQDYAALKAAGGPKPDQISVALTRYLHVMKAAESRPQMNGPGWWRGPVISFQCVISKALSDEIRNLGGRLDSHMIEAVRLFFRGKAVAANAIQPGSNGGAYLHTSLVSAAFGAVGLFIQRVLGL